jgi:hypothetical protein
MTRTARTLATTAAIAFALIAVCSSANAQDMVVPADGLPVVYAPALTIYPQPFSACKVERRQFDDVYGWRVRDVLVCPPRQAAPWR